MNIKEIYTGPLFVKTWAVKLDLDTILLIDPGGSDDELIEYLEENKPERLEIMLTHGHFDHVGGVPYLLEKYPSSSIWIHPADSAYLGKIGKEQHIACFKQIRAERYIVNFKYDFPEPTGFLHNGDEVNGFKVLHTPGHTEGSVCFWNRKENVLFSGDTLFYKSQGRVDLLGGDEKKMYNSLKSLLSLPDETVVYPGHGANTSIKAERLRLEAMLDNKY